MLQYQRSRMRADLFACAAFAVASENDVRRGYNKNEEETPNGRLAGIKFNPRGGKTRRKTMAVISMKHLLEAGVHFGHQTRRWNPKMAQYIFTERNGIYIIDLQKTVKKIDEAYMFVRNLAMEGKTILFVCSMSTTAGWAAC